MSWLDQNNPEDCLMDAAYWAPTAPVPQGVQGPPEVPHDALILLVPPQVNAPYGIWRSKDWTALVFKSLQSISPIVVFDLNTGMRMKPLEEQMRINGYVDNSKNCRVYLQDQAGREMCLEYGAMLIRRGQGMWAPVGVRRPPTMTVAGETRSCNFDNLRKQAQSLLRGSYYYGGTVTGRFTERAEQFFGNYETTDQRSNEMVNTKEAIPLMQLQQGASIFTATYPGCPGKEYTFKNVIGSRLEEGDLVVVETRDAYAIVEVVTPRAKVTGLPCSYSDLKHLVTKIDTKAIAAVKEAEENAEHRLAMSEVYDRLNTFREQIGESGMSEIAAMLTGPSKKKPETDVIDEGDITSY